MQICYSGLAALLVAVIFYAYRGYTELQQQRERLLRERVAYLLWVAANGLEETARGCS